MGGAVSCGVDNDDLVDRLANAGYIRSRLVERIFRAVDRGHYYTETPPILTEDRDGGTYEADAERRKAAYRDMAWKFGLLHLSAPCVYSQVVESLRLEPGLSFLNLGSGTGYLSTVVGLIIGPHGVNHGVEIHEEVVRYANWKLHEFKLSSDALYEFELCEPKFIIGNCLCLDSGVMQYDRVYCGAACPESYENYMKNLLKVGGILVMPLNHQLMQITRTSETQWETIAVLPVSFASLILPVQNNNSSKDSNHTVKLPSLEPLGLQDNCRQLIRTLIRKKMESEHPILCKRSYVRRIRQKLQRSNDDLLSDSKQGDNPRRSGEGGGSRQSSLRDGNNDGLLRSLGLVVFRELEGIRNMDQVLTLIHVNRRLLGRGAPRASQGNLRRAFLRNTFLEERTAFGEGEDGKVNEMDEFRELSSSLSSSSSSPSESYISTGSDDDDDEEEDEFLQLSLPEDVIPKHHTARARNRTTSQSVVETASNPRDEDEICESKVKRLRLQNNENHSSKYSVDINEPSSSQPSSTEVNNRLPSSTANAKSDRAEKPVLGKTEQELNPSNETHPCAPTPRDENESSKSSFHKEPMSGELHSHSDGNCNEREEAMSISSDSHPLSQSNDDGSNEYSVKASSSSGSEEYSFSNVNDGKGKMTSSVESKVVLDARDKVCDENSENLVSEDVEKEEIQNNGIDDKEPKDGITYSNLMRAHIQSLPLPPMLKLYLNYQRPL